MKKEKWKQFSRMTGKCYENMIGADKDGSCWMKTFELLKELIHEERKDDPGFAPELESIDDVTDYSFDILGWLDDCMDEMDMRGEYETLLGICNDLLGMFSWTEYTDSDIKFRKSFFLRELGRNEEAEKYCRDWLKNEPDNIFAATACIYTFIEVKKYEEAEKLVGNFITDSTICTDDNYIILMAASKLYEALDEKDKKRKIDKALEEYDEGLESYYEDGLFDEEDLDLFDEELPF